MFCQCTFIAVSTVEAKKEVDIIFCHISVDESMARRPNMRKMKRGLDSTSDDR